MDAGDRPQALSETWWIRLPLAARQLAIRPIFVLVDGLYLAVWPRAAAILSPLALFLGLLLGALHPGYDQVFSQSWPVLLLAIVAGVMSGHLGALFLVGYAFGDFFLWHSDWSFRGSLIQNLLRVRLPLLIEYGLLAFMTTGIPLATKALLVQLPPPSSLPRQLRRALAFAGHLILTLLLVYLWAQVVPVLIRPVFTWPGGTPPVDAMTILQERSWPLLLIAGLASLARMTLQHLAVTQPNLRQRLDELEAQLSNAEPVTPLTSQLPLPAVIAVTALWSTFMLSGMLQAWYDGVILAAILLFLQSARAGLIPLPVDAWARQVARIPIPLRLLVGLIVVSYVSRLALGALMARTNTFRPILFVTIVALLVFYLLDPLRSDLHTAEE